MRKGRTSKTTAFVANGLPYQIKILRDSKNAIYSYEADKPEKIIFACEKYITAYIQPGMFIVMKNYQGQKTIKSEEFSIERIREFYEEKETAGDPNSLF